MVPSWLHWLSISSLVLAVLSAIFIAGDIFRGHRQQMQIMNVVWPLTGLYFGPLGVWFYYSFGRQSAAMQGHEMMHSMPMTDGTPKNAPHKGHHSSKPFWQTTLVGTTHCGAGCTLGDIIGEWAVFLFGWTIAGMTMWASYVADFVLAFLFGIIFQYFAIVPMRHLKPAQGILAALKADTLSISAFEIGMFGWMALSRFVLLGFETKPTQPIYWFTMQIAMIVGFATSYPMNWWLIKRGWKEAM